MTQFANVMALLLVAFIARSAIGGGSDGVPSTTRIEEVATLDEIGGRIVAFSRDGKRVLTANDMAAQLWDTATWQPIGARMEHGAGMHIAAFDAMGTRVLTVGSVSENGRILRGEAKVWDGRTGRLVRGQIHHGKQPVSWAAISPDGTLVATCCEEDRRVRVWDVASGRERIVLDHANRIGAVQFDPTGRILLATGVKNTVWNARSWRVERTLPGTNAGPPVPAFTPDGKRVVIATDTTFEVYDCSSGQKIGDNAARSLHLDEFMRAVAISPDGRYVATTSMVGAAVWDAKTGEPLIRGIDAFDGQPLFSPDGSLVIFNTAPPSIWSVSGRRRLEWGYKRFGGAACFSPDGKTVAFGTFDDSTLILRIGDSAPDSRPSSIGR